MPAYTVRIKDSDQQVTHCVAIWATTRHLAIEFAMDRVVRLIGTQRGRLEVLPPSKMDLLIRRSKKMETETAEEVTPEEEAVTAEEVEAAKEATTEKLDLGTEDVEETDEEEVDESDEEA